MFEAHNNKKNCLIKIHVRQTITRNCLMYKLLSIRILWIMIVSTVTYHLPLCAIKRIARPLQKPSRAIRLHCSRQRALELWSLDIVAQPLNSVEHVVVLASPAPESIAPAIHRLEDLSGEECHAAQHSSIGEMVTVFRDGNG